MTGLEAWVEIFANKCADLLPECNVYHIEKAPESECPVICWQEINSTRYYGDDACVATLLQLQIDYFTETEFDQEPATISRLLDEIGMYSVMEGIDFDTDRDQWRYIWTVSVWVNDDE